MESVMEYVNKLTDNELKDILTCLVTNYCEATNFNDDCYIHHNYSSVTVEGTFDTVTIDGAKCSTPVKLELDDYHVYNSNFELNWAMTQGYRKCMFDKYEQQYAIDCFWSDCDGDEIVKIASTDPNLDTINKWRQVINNI